MTDPSFRSFLTRSLAVLQRELPRAYEGVLAALAGREVWIEADGVGTSLWPRDDELLALDAPYRPAVRARASRRALAELLEARYTLAEAIYNDRIELRGELDDLLAFYDALDAYFRGAVRCPSFSALLDAYLGQPGAVVFDSLPPDFARL